MIHGVTNYLFKVLGRTALKRDRVYGLRMFQEPRCVPYIIPFNLCNRSQGLGEENVVVVKVADKTEEADEETCLCSPVNAKALSVSPLLLLNSARYPTYSVR